MRERSKEFEKPAHEFVPVLINDNRHSFDRPEFRPVYEIISRTAGRPAQKILHLQKEADFLPGFDRFFHYGDEYVLVVLIGQLSMDQEPDGSAGTFGQLCYHT
jgi:hypothetical protein